MKTKKLSKKLVLNKKTVASLNNAEIKDIKGGETGLYTCQATCNTACPTCNTECSCVTCFPCSYIVCTEPMICPQWVKFVSTKKVRPRVSGLLSVGTCTCRHSRNWWRPLTDGYLFY